MKAPMSKDVKELLSNTQNSKKLSGIVLRATGLVLIL